MESGKEEEGQPLAPLFADNVGTSVAYARCGEGDVIVLPDGWSLSNQGATAGGNLALVLNALRHRDPSREATVTFDEFHHGYSEGKGLLSLIGTPARLGLAQIGLAFVLLVFATSRRLGKPIPLREGARQRGEYLGSMAALLRKAGATDMVRRELGRRFLHDIAVAVGVAPGSSVEAIIDATQRRSPQHVKAVTELCREAMADGHSSEAAVLTLARRWHKMREDLTR